jgi:hypothetical protein
MWTKMLVPTVNSRSCTGQSTVDRKLRNNATVYAWDSSDRLSKKGNKAEKGQDVRYILDSSGRQAFIAPGTVVLHVISLFGGLWLVVVRHGSTIRDDNIHFRSIVGSTTGIFYLSHNIHALDNMTKHDVFSVQVRSILAGDEELASIRSGPSVRHG